MTHNSSVTQALRVRSSFLTRREAAAYAKKVNGKVLRAGAFANGSFGLYSRRQGEHLINVWHVQEPA